MTRRAASLLAAAALTLTLAGCGGSSTASPSSPAGASAPASSASAATGVTVEGAWAKSGKGMTGVFATLRNPGSAPVTITGATSPAAAMVEVHETVRAANGSGQMQKKQGGLVIPPGSSVELKPGGDHIMLMQLAKPLAPGDQVVVTLTTDGAPVQVTAEVRDFDGGNETYHTHSS